MNFKHCPLWSERRGRCTALRPEMCTCFGPCHYEHLVGQRAELVTAEAPELKQPEARHAR